MQDELPPAGAIRPEDQITSEVQPKIEPNVIHELGDIATTDSEFTTSSSVDSQNGSVISIDDLSSPEAIEKRVERALEKVDFEETPELREALTDYYESNYALASLLDMVMSEDPSTLTPAQKEARQEELQREIDALTDYGYQFDDTLNENHWASIRSGLNSGRLPPAIGRIAGPLLAKIRQERLTDPNNEQLEIIEQLLLPVCAASLFNEASVCITSIDEDELKLISELDGRVATTLEESKHFSIDRQGFHVGFIRNAEGEIEYTIPPYSFEGISRKKSEELFWQEIRQAGQLFFHNTSGLAPILTGKGLHTRRMSLLHTGEFNTQNSDMLGDTLHAPTVHWSEIYEGDAYKDGPLHSPGTIAMPIREIIATAPIARDIEYGVLTVKQDRKGRVLEKIQKTPVTSSRSIGAGGSDAQGAIGLDRTFYSSAIDVSWDTPLSQAPDGHTFPITKDQYLLVREDKYAEELAIAEAEKLGIIEPTIVTIDQELTSSTIERIQTESIGRWPNDFVIPIRSGGVMTFKVGDDMQLGARPDARFRIRPKDSSGELRP